MKKLLMVLAILALMAGQALATANAISKTGNAVSVVFDGSHDLDFATDATVKLPKGCQLVGIVWAAAAIGDVMTVRDGSATGTTMLPLVADTSRNGVLYIPVLYNSDPYIKGSEVTANMVATFFFRLPK